MTPKTTEQTSRNAKVVLHLILRITVTKSVGTIVLNEILEGTKATLTIHRLFVRISEEATVKVCILHTTFLKKKTQHIAFCEFCKDTGPRKASPICYSVIGCYFVLEENSKHVQGFQISLLEEFLSTSRGKKVLDRA